MENKPDQTNTEQPSNIVVPSTPVPTPAPAEPQVAQVSPEAPIQPTPSVVTPQEQVSAPAPVQEFSSQWSPGQENESSAPNKLGLLSLGAGLLAGVLMLLIIFVSSLASSSTMMYVWFFVFLALGVAGLVLGIRSEKTREKLSITGLIGIILSVIICSNCLLLGAYYIKVQMTINSFESSYSY